MRASQSQVSQRPPDAVLAYLGVICLAAATFIILAFLDSQREGLRSVLLFLTPFAWGWFGWVGLRGVPAVFGAIVRYVMPAGGVISGLVVAGTLVYDAPYSLSNLMLGAMAALPLLLFASERRGKSAWGRDERALVAGLLLMFTTVSIVVSVTS